MGYKIDFSRFLAKLYSAIGLENNEGKIDFTLLVFTISRGLILFDLLSWAGQDNRLNAAPSDFLSDWQSEPPKGFDSEGMPVGSMQ